MSSKRRDRPTVFQRLGQVFQLRSTPRYVEREIDAEIDYHFDRRVEALIDQGMSRPDAEREAHCRFGDVSEHRDRLGKIDRRRQSMEWRTQWAEISRENVRYGLRGLGKSRGFTATVVATLALGIGANATMFGVIDRLLLSPPTGIVQPDDVRRLYITRGFDRGRPFTSATTTYADVSDWMAADSFEITAFSDRSVTFGRGEAARRVLATLTDANFFDLLGVAPQLGRYFTDEEDRSLAPVIVISDHMWRQELDTDTDILGSQLTVRGADFTVIGVAPPGFVGVNLRRVDAWFPPRSPANSDDSGQWETNRNYYWLRALVRISGDSVKGPEAEATTLHFAERADTSSNYDPEAVVSFAPLVAARGARASDESKVAQWLAGVSPVVLLIACANVANLLLARGLRRQREIGIRLALGVSLSRLIAQLVTESMLLAILGGLAALAVAYWGAAIMRTVLLPDVHWPAAPLSGRVLWFTLVASMGAGLLAGLVPALQSTRHDLMDVLRAGGRGGGAVGYSRRLARRPSGALGAAARRRRIVRPQPQRGARPRSRHRPRSRSSRDTRDGMGRQERRRGCSFLSRSRRAPVPPARGRGGGHCGIDTISDQLEPAGAVFRRGGATQDRERWSVHRRGDAGRLRSPRPTDRRRARLLARRG